MKMGNLGLVAILFILGSCLGGGANHASGSKSSSQTGAEDDYNQNISVTVPDVNGEEKDGITPDSNSAQSSSCVPRTDLTNSRCSANSSPVTKYTVSKGTASNNCTTI